MIRVLIVDDEILIRVGIKSCIDWEANGFEIVGLAEDGNEALEMIDKFKPDIVLTDIKMPGMDGLELIDITKKLYPNIRTIVLSCYNEFEFIKTAMKLGADDYILKLSMQPEDLLKVMTSTKYEIEKSRDIQLEADGSPGDIRINKYFLKEELYKRAIESSISGDELVEELRKLGSLISFSLSGIICAGIDDYSQASVVSRMEDQYLLKIAVTNIMEEILSNFCKGDVVEIEKGEYLIILDYCGQPADYRSTVEEYCGEVNNALKNYLNISASFGISGMCKNPGNFRNKYLEARTALERKFYQGRESIVFYSPDEEFTDKIVLLNFEIEKILVSNLENADNKGAKEIVNEFFLNIREQKEYQPTKVRMAALEILHSIIKVAKKYEVEDEFGSFASVNGENPVDILIKAETVMDIKEWFNKIIDDFADCLFNKRLCNERPEILKLKRYISEKIYEDITLDKASQITNMSKSYLSTIFKKETGESFTDYVNRRKMEEAKELIQRYDLKTYEAAEKLGYNDESYFSKLFKKYVGVSPSKVGK